MKKLLIVLGFFLAILLFLNFKTANGNYLLAYSACSQPLTYRIGSVDPRFNLSENEVISRTNEAASIWNSASQRVLFAYDPDGDIVIDLVYDQRQALSTEVTQLEQELDENKNGLDPQIAAYKERAAAFERKIDDLNERIRYWNSQGGAPAEEYEKLQNERSALAEEAAALNAIAYNLNQSTREYNSHVGQLNSTIRELNQSLRARPEQGIYDSATNTIAIFFHSSQDELIHTLAHELGHARGLEHVEDENAIMHTNSNEALSLSASDRQALTDVCQDRSYTDFIIERYQNLLHNIKLRLQQDS